MIFVHFLNTIRAHLFTRYLGSHNIGGFRVSFVRWVIFAILLFCLVVFIQFSMAVNWFYYMISTHTAFTCVDIVIRIFYRVYGRARRISITGCISSNSIWICIAGINCILLGIVLASIARPWILFNCPHFCFYLIIHYICCCCCIFIWATHISICLIVIAIVIVSIIVSVSVRIGSVCILFRIRTIAVSICIIFIWPIDAIVVGGHSGCLLPGRIKSWSNWRLFIIFSSLWLN